MEKPSRDRIDLASSKDAVTAQRQVSETTNDLLKKNSEMLKISAIETAKENERGIVDIETLQTTQNDLIETIQETLRIQKEGKEKRRHAEVELGHMEEDAETKTVGFNPIDHLSLVTKTNAQQQFITTVDGRFSYLSSNFSIGVYFSFILLCP